MPSHWRFGFNMWILWGYVQSIVKLCYRQDGYVWLPSLRTAQFNSRISILTMRRYDANDHCCCNSHFWCRALKVQSLVTVGMVTVLTQWLSVCQGYWEDQMQELTGSRCEPFLSPNPCGPMQMTHLRRGQDQKAFIKHSSGVVLRRAT